MKRRPYSAGTVKLAFWFQEFRKMVELLNQGKTFDEIKKLNQEQNIFGASTPSRLAQIFSTVSARIKCMDPSFYPIFLQEDITGQKQLALAATLAQDTLLYEFVFEVIHEKLILGDDVLNDMDMRDFFRQKQGQSEKAAAWTDQTLQRLGRAYRTILMEAGILIKNKESWTIEVPFLDENVKDWLENHDMTEIVRALSDR